MKKNIFSILLFVISIFIITGCTDSKKIMEDPKPDDHNAIKESENNEMETITNIQIIINGKKYNAILEDNDTVQAFINLLPQEFHMSELNGNEKYIYMDKSLPTNASNPGQILAGDIMLYGNDCLVIFYKSFHTSYRYTKIGHIDNMSDLGDGNVIVQFEK